MPTTMLHASLVRYAKIDGLGWRRGSIVASRNGRVKPDAMLCSGKECSIPANSAYQIRHYQDGKAVYTTVGTDYDAARATLDRFTATRQRDAADVVLGIITPAPVEAPKTLVEHLAEYLTKKQSPSLDLSRASIHVYTATLPEFVRRSKRTFASEITEADVVAFVDHLRHEGYSQKTCAMRYTTVRGFLRACDVHVDKIIDSATHKRLSVKPDANTDPYTEPELDRLFAVCDDRYRMIFNFLLSTGMRYREANHLRWEHIDWVRCMIHVPGEERINRTYHKGGQTINKAVVFRTKSRKGREVPIFASLLPLLKAWREAHPATIYVFGTRSDMPNNHWLEYGKQFWKDAGLNCGVCDGCHGKVHECDGFYLHKFRHTFAHRCLDAGIPIHKVSKWMGHHSIEVTAIYLSGGSTAADRDPFCDRRAA